MLSLKKTQNNDIHFYNRGMSQAKENVAVPYITYPVNHLLAESMSSNPLPHQKQKIHMQNLWYYTALL